MPISSLHRHIVSLIKFTHYSLKYFSKQESIYKELVDGKPFNVPKQGSLVNKSRKEIVMVAEMFLDIVDPEHNVLYSPHSYSIKIFPQHYSLYFILKGYLAVIRLVQYFSLIKVAKLLVFRTVWLIL